MIKKKLKKRSHSFEEASRIVKLCTEHAQTLLDSSKLLYKHNMAHIAFHLAVIALEEIGKATMTVMGLSFPGKAYESTLLERHHDVHIKKIFWALWMPSLKSTDLDLEKIKTYREVATKIHDDRLRCLYIDTDCIQSPQQTIKKVHVKKIIKLVEARINLETIEKLHRLNVEEKNELQWFIQSCEDTEKRKLIFGKKSLKKLGEFKDNVRKWIKWMRQQFDEADKESQLLLRTELSRVKTGGEEGLCPKWRLTIRLFTNSHSIHRPVLGWWNTHVNIIKLHFVKKNELTAEFILPKDILSKNLWHIGWGICRQFVVSLNIASRGFFWWSVPKDISRFYEKLIDIESDCEVRAERSPLKIDFGNQVLKEIDLARTLIIFQHLSNIVNDSELAPYNIYITGLTFLSKNDLHSQFETQIFMNFFQSLTLGMKIYNFWKKKEPLNKAVERFFAKSTIDIKDCIRVVDMAVSIEKRKVLSQSVSLSEVAVMKKMCDIYFSNLSMNLLLKNNTELKSQYISALISTLQIRLNKHI